MFESMPAGLKMDSTVVYSHNLISSKQFVTNPYTYRLNIRHFVNLDNILSYMFSLEL